MRWTPALPFLVLVTSILVTGCPKKKGDGSDAASDAEAGASDATAGATGPEAANAEAIARFPDEVAIDHQAATVQSPSAAVRKTPQSGEIVAPLPKGTNVVQIASHDKFILVTFDNPKNASERLMGWVVKDAFSAPGAVVHPTVTDGGVSPASADGGAPAAADAGAAKDAGGGVAPADAGGGGGGGGGGGAMVVEPGAGGTCPAGYKISHPDEKCHHGCTPGKDGDCSTFGPGVFCTRGGYCKMR